MLGALPDDRSVNKSKHSNIPAQVQRGQVEVHKSSQFVYSDIIQKTALHVVDRIKERHTGVVYSRCSVFSIREHLGFVQIDYSGYAMIPLHSQDGPHSPTHLSYQILDSITPDEAAVNVESQDFEIRPCR